MQGGGDIHFTLDMVYGAEPKQVKATALVKRDISKGGPSITPEGKGNNDISSSSFKQERVVMTPMEAHTSRHNKKIQQ